MVITMPPIATISIGCRMPSNVAMRPLTSLSWLLAALDNISSSRPPASPLDIRWIIMGGNNRLSPNEPLIVAPHERVRLLH